LVVTSTAIHDAQDRSALFKALKTSCTLFGFGRFILSCHAPTNRDVVVNATLTSFRDDFREDYGQPNWVADDIWSGMMQETI
jgi:hypothetical protein